MKKQFLPIVILALALTAGACSLARLTKINHNDYNFQGFINDDLYQVLLTDKPDRDAEGLVRQRESAFFRASKDARKKVTDLFVQYMITMYEKKEKLSLEPELRTQVAAKLKSLSPLMHPAFEYYHEDNSVVLGYRLYSPGLKKNAASTIASTIKKHKEKQDKGDAS